MLIWENRAFGKQSEDLGKAACTNGQRHLAEMYSYSSCPSWTHACKRALYLISPAVYGLITFLMTNTKVVGATVTGYSKGYWYR